MGVATALLVVGAVELVVVGVVEEQRAAMAGVDCQVFGQCDGMPDNLWELFAPYVTGAVLGSAIAAGRGAA